MLHAAMITSFLSAAFPLSLLLTGGIMGDNILKKLNKLIIWTLIIACLVGVIGIVIWKQMT